MALPVCIAWIVQVPAATSVTVIPDTVQTPVDCERKLTVKPELAFALSAKGAVPNARFERTPKVMVCAIWAPMPDSCAFCALVALLSALSVSVTVPVSVPLIVGAKATAIKHCPEEDSCELEVQSVPPESVCVKYVVIARFDTVNGWLPALETVRTCEVVVEPILVLAKTSGAACVRLSLITLPESVT